MKFKLLVVLFSSLFVSQAFAECKSVMGTCVKQDLVNSAPHMRSDYVEKTKIVKAPAKSIAANGVIKKANSTGVFSTMQKTAAK